jgi:uncharacterized repeat protein (TIGR01451 family)
VTRRYAWILPTLVALLALAATPAAAGEIVQNGGFETGDFGTSWTHGAFRKNKQNPSLADHSVETDLPFTGNYSALLGFKYTGQGNASAYMYQDVAVPSNISSATLGFAHRMQGYDGDFYATFIVDIRSTGGDVLENVVTTSFTEFDDKFKDGGWRLDDDSSPAGYDLSAYAGQTIRLYFQQSNLNDNNLETWTFVDDVSLVYRKWIDLVVGGEGDDAFGAIGSGAGGLFAESGVAGDTLYYTLSAQNEGPVPDAYQLSASVPAGWSVYIDAGAGWQSFPVTTPVVAVGGSLDYEVMVVSPSSSTGGSYDVVVDGLSTAEGNRFDSATLRANVVDAVYATDAVVDGNGFGVTGENGAGGFALQSTTWDAPVVFDVEIINAGNQATAFDVDFETAAGAVASVTYDGVQYSGAFTTASIDDGEAATMTLELAVPAPHPGGDYEAILTAAAVGDTLRRDSIKAVARLQEPRLDLVIVTNGDGVYDATMSGKGGSSTIAAELGLTVNYPLLVQNESALPDSFTFDWVAPGGGWRAVLEIDGVEHEFPVTSPAFAPFSQATYVLKVTIRNGASYGTYRSVLNAVSMIDDRVSESVAASISVSNSGEIDLLIDGDGLALYGPVGTGLGGLSTRAAAPGDTVVFDVTVLNVSGLDSHDLSWQTPPGWEVTLAGSSSPVIGLAAGTYGLRVVVPPSAAGGNVDVIVDGQKTDKPFLMDSVTGRVFVAPAARVDGLIDGDGDGVYGATGTGAGGASQQTAPAPATVAFTVEIQNEGGSSDQYQVTWGSIGGLPATFGGGLSPFVTAPIPPGGSLLYAFEVVVPTGATTGTYPYPIDVVSTSDPTSFESLTATVVVLGPPRADLVIDGDGAGVFGVMGSGQGGRSVRGGNPGTVYLSTLRVRNAGSFADSFRVQWEPPPGWPVGSIVVNDGTADHTAPFWTQVLSGGQFVDYTVGVQVPATADAAHTTIINAWSSLPPNATESVALVTETRVVVRGVVFDDRDQSGDLGAGDVPLSGVTVMEVGTGLAAVTDAAGAYAITVTGPARLTVVERNPSGYVSSSPDTLGPFVADAGDTVVADFADVAPLTLTAGSARAAMAGGLVDFPHVLRAGSAGHVDLTASNDVGASTTFLLDANGNGVFDAGDRTLAPADTDLDPAFGGGAVAILLRLFVPAGTPAGKTIHVVVTASQLLGGGGSLEARATDAAIVVGDALGRLSLAKAADRADATPGELITYSITFFNTGVDSVRNLVILDPISPWVDLEPDAFGPGADLEWTSGAGAPSYLTFDPADADECEYSPAEHLLRMLFSKNGAFYLAPGETGVVTYRVRVR